MQSFSLCYAFYQEINWSEVDLRDVVYRGLAYTSYSVWQSLLLNLIDMVSSVSHPYRSDVQVRCLLYQCLYRGRADLQYGHLPCRILVYLTDMPIIVFQLCVICGDPFEQYWDEEAEEWHLRNAISVAGKVG